MLSDNPAITCSPQHNLRPSSQPISDSFPKTFSDPTAGPGNGHVAQQSQPVNGSSASASSSRLASPTEHLLQTSYPQHGLSPLGPPVAPLSEYHSGYGENDWPLSSSNLNHRRQSSFPNLLSLPFRSRTRSPIEKTHARSGSEQMPYTGDGRRNWNSTTDNQRSGGLVGWFSGTTGAANALGSSLQSETRSGAGAKGSQKDGITPDSTPTASRRGMNGSGVPVSDLSTPKNSISTASRFMSAISSRFTTMTPTKSDVDIESDEFYNLHIEAALFPNGPPSDRDTFSPAAFKNLHMNAIGLLTRMQAAYRERMNTIRDLQAERSAQQDEVEEAETRSRHLKLQLEDMARKAQEHEQKLKVLMEELAAEKRARAAAEKAVSTALSHSERASMIMEDLGVDEDRRRRRNKNIRKSWKSGASCDHLDDEDISDDENESVTESESVFSRCRSPLPAPSATPSTADTPDSNGQSQPRQQAPSTTGTPTTTSTPKQPQKHPQQLSAFQKIFRGITGDSSSGCPNCKGQDASVAWDTVSLLRDENKHLKQRVSELEVAVEGALDVVNGLGLLQLAK